MRLTILLGMIVTTMLVLLMNVISIDAACFGLNRVTCMSQTCACGMACQFEPDINPKTIAPLKRSAEAAQEVAAIGGDCLCPVDDIPCPTAATVLTQTATTPKATTAATSTTVDVLETTAVRRTTASAPTISGNAPTTTANTVGSSVVEPSSTTGAGGVITTTSTTTAASATTTKPTTTRSGPKMERINMWNLTAAELSSGTVALSTGHVQCAGKTGANKMYKVNSTAVLDLVFTPPRRLMRVELAEFGANDVGQVTASPAAKRAVLTVMLNFAETDVSAQIRSAYGRYRFAGVDVSSDFSVSALELMPASSDAQATDRPASDSISADTGDDGGFPWWAIVIIVIGALVFGAGVGLVVFRSIKQRKEDDGAAHNAAASSAARQSEAATSTELGAVTAHDRASVVSSTSTAANYQSLQEVEQYHDLHLKDDDTPDAELEETSAGTVKAKVGHYQKADMAGPGHHYDKIHPEAFKNN